MKIRATLALGFALLIGGLVVGVAIAADEKAPKTSKALTATAAAAGETAPGKDVKCPISGKAVDPNATVMFEECKVYLCCNKCPKAWEGDKDHAKYGAKAHHQMVQTGQLKQTACPFTGKPTDDTQVVEIAGVKVAFCCDKCKGKVEKTKEDARVGLVFKDTKKGFKLAKDADKTDSK
jgi:hypothetical protein